MKSTATVFFKVIGTLVVMIGIFVAYVLSSLAVDTLFAEMRMYFSPLWVYFSFVTGIIFFGIAHVIDKVNLATARKRSPLTVADPWNIAASVHQPLQVLEKSKQERKRNEAAVKSEAGGRTVSEQPKSMSAVLEKTSDAVDNAKLGLLKKVPLNNAAIEAGGEETAADNNLSVKTSVYEALKNQEVATGGTGDGDRDRNAMKDELNTYDFASIQRSRKDRHSVEKNQKKQLFGLSKRSTAPPIERIVKEDKVHLEKTDNSNNNPLGDVDVPFDIFINLSKYCHEKYKKKPYMISSAPLVNHYYLFLNRKQKIHVEITKNQITEKNS
ncbi:hypothetical protein SAMN05421736_11738 [Evansella caseinilytica]|uniref:Uncharacterized protein n=1 Tax=Evansella caseinilytica TaxID=1503961 RepID=A0A1H3U0E2_9BACI|nr:hypothetical protein [Evansella caseinilytica]SDZ55976.1 hypothetical protein SAMN05421736_11738 [Evansella caseinilytica]